MSLLIKGKGGITKLSELEIDDDKDWKHKKILNLENTIQSDPPPTKCQVVNIFYDPDLEKVAVEKQTVPAP